MTSLDVDDLFTMELSLGRFVAMPGGPHGTRVCAPILGGTVSGPRLTADVEPGGSDFVTVRADGVGQLDVRLVMRTNDGATIFMSYRGVYDASSGKGPRSAPLFEAADPRYAWLNNVQAVGIGTPSEDSTRVVYQVYALR